MYAYIGNCTTFPLFAHFYQYVLCPDNWIFLNHGHYQKGRYVEIKEIIQIPMRAKFANYFLKCILG